jgi:hypothetical protein
MIRAPRRITVIGTKKANRDFKSVPFIDSGISGIKQNPISETRIPIDQLCLPLRNLCDFDTKWKITTFVNAKTAIAINNVMI